MNGSKMDGVILAGVCDNSGMTAWPSGIGLSPDNVPTGEACNPGF